MSGIQKSKEIKFKTVPSRKESLCQTRDLGIFRAVSPDRSEEKISPEGTNLPDEALGTHFSVN